MRYFCTKALLTTYFKLTVEKDFEPSNIISFHNRPSVDKRLTFALSSFSKLSKLEIARKQSLYCLQKSLSDSEEILLKLEEVAPR